MPGQHSLIPQPTSRLAVLDACYPAVHWQYKPSIWSAVLINTTTDSSDRSVSAAITAAVELTLDFPPLRGYRTDIQLEVPAGPAELSSCKSLCTG